MKVQAIEDATPQLLNRKDERVGLAKMFLIKVDINKNNNSLRESSNILGSVVGNNLPDNVYGTVTDAINKENEVDVNRNELRELTSFTETVFIEDADRNIQEVHVKEASDYSKTAIALVKDDEAVVYANYQDVYLKVQEKTNTSSKKEELLALRDMIQEVASVSVNDNAYEVAKNEEIVEQTGGMTR